MRLTIPSVSLELSYSVARRVRVALAVLLCLSVFLQACAGSVTSRSSATSRELQSASGASTVAETSAASAKPEDSAGGPRWAWWTAAGVAAVGTVVAVMALVVVPAIANGAAKAVAEAATRCIGNSTDPACRNGSSGNRGVLPIGS